MRKILIVVLSAGALALAATPALAASNPSQGTYGGSGANQLSQVQSLASTKSTPTAASSLPFTGLNVVVVIVIAAALLGAGVVLRGRTRSDHQR